MLIDKKFTVPPGKLIDAGNYQLHLFARGMGEPAVIIESGLAGGAMVWGRVQPEIATETQAETQVETQVVTYDRAGYGWSDDAPHARSLDEMVLSLHTMLANAEIKPPYILVGHSFGGLIVRLFASRYPQEVAGLVLVDALSEHLFTRAPSLYREWSRGLERMFLSLQFIARLGLLRLLLALGQSRLLPQVVTRQPEQQQALLLAGGFLSGKNFATARAERRLFEASAERVRKAEPLQDVPLIVLSHGRATMFSRLPFAQAQRAEQLWQELQAEQAQASPQGQFIVAERSGHDIHIDQPELVIEVIRQLVIRQKEKGIQS